MVRDIEVEFHGTIGLEPVNGAAAQTTGADEATRERRLADVMIALEGNATAVCEAIANAVAGPDTRAAGCNVSFAAHETDPTFSARVQLASAHAGEPVHVPARSEIERAAAEAIRDWLSSQAASQAKWRPVVTVLGHQAQRSAPAAGSAAGMARGELARGRGGASAGQWVAIAAGAAVVFAVIWFALNSGA